MNIIWRQPVLYFLVVLITVIAVLNYYAFQNFWYWRIVWFDLVMHFLGGLFVSVSIIWLYLAWNRLSLQEAGFRRILFIGLAGALVVGGAWELFEFGVDYYWQVPIHLKTFTDLQESHLDTLSDLAFDVIGAIFGSLLLWFTPLINNIRKNNE